MKLLDDIKGCQSSYEPYKYVMSDVGNIYIGAKFTYEEMLENNEIPFKVKSIISHYILKESDPTNALEGEFYYMNPDSFIYKTFEQLKTRVKVSVLENKVRLFGKTKTEYVEKTITLKELADMNLAQKKGAGLFVSEIIISKLALMSFTL